MMQSKMIHTDRVLIVEGKYDAARLAHLTDAMILLTDGFGIYKDKKRQQLCRFQLGQGRLPGQPVPQQQNLPLPRRQRFQQLPHPEQVCLLLTAFLHAKAVLYHVR